VTTGDVCDGDRKKGRGCKSEVTRNEVGELCPGLGVIYVLKFILQHLIASLDMVGIERKNDDVS
jgi:hypothetical protein